MNLTRGVVVALVLLVVWRSEVATLVRSLVVVTPTPAPVVTPEVPAFLPSADAKAWVAAVNANAILPADRMYVADFYGSMDWVLGNDGDHDAPKLDTTEKFRRAHSASLDVAIARGKVGKYPGLGESIDRALALAAAGISDGDCKDEEKVAKAINDGLSPRPMTKALRERIRDCCRALEWKLRINGE